MSAKQDEAPELFPAGVAVALLGAGFVVTRVFARATQPRLSGAGLGVFALVAGALLALVAVQRVAWSARTPVGVRAARSLLLLPMSVLAVASMLGEPTRAVQTLALAATATTVLASCAAGILRSLRTPGAALHAAPLALLLVGETCELYLPALRLAVPPWSPAARTLDHAGAVFEAIAFAGVALAAIAATRSALRRVGITRLAPFATLPAALIAVTASLPVNFPRRTTDIAKHAFGVRFDLVGGAGLSHPSRPVIAAYTLLFSGLLTAAMMSLAAQRADGGAGVRRALGWSCVLIAGFGATTAVGSVDALRVIALSLGVVLLEDAAAREGAAPADQA